MPYEHSSCVLLADSHHGLTEGVRGLLETAFGTVIMVADEASLLEGARRVQPDVAVVDLSLARHGDLDWLRALRERCPGMKVIVLSVHDEESVRQAAHRRRSRRVRAQARDRDRPSARDRAPQEHMSDRGLAGLGQTHDGGRDERPLSK